MALNTKALAITSGALFAGCFLFVGVANLIWDSYGVALLNLGASIYPGYDGPNGFGSVIVVSLYALVDGAIGGAIFGWLYNTVAGQGGSSAA